MPDYQSMYATLFQSITQVIDILQYAQQVAEEMYISAEETVIRLLPSDEKDKKDDDRP